MPGPSAQQRPRQPSEAQEDLRRDLATARPHAWARPIGDDAEVNSELLGWFASLETRSGRRAASTGPRCRGGVAGSLTLPAQEQEASLAAQAERRDAQAQLERRYGPHAADVRALEAVLNEAFDRISQAEQPVLWPSAPLAPRA